MKKFEYKQVDLKFNSGKTFIEVLSQEGENGWEFVSKENLEEKSKEGDFSYFRITGIKIIFKREKID